MSQKDDLDVLDSIRELGIDLTNDLDISDCCDFHGFNGTLFKLVIGKTTVLFLRTETGLLTIRQRHQLESTTNRFCILPEQVVQLLMKWKWEKI